MLGERDAKKEVLRLTFENDELVEKLKFMESKFQSLVQRVGASKEDIEAVNSQIASKFKNKPPRESFSNNQKFLSG